MTPPDRRSSTTASVRALLVDLMGWHINSLDAPYALGELRERAVVMTGRIDLADLDVRDVSCRSRLLEALEDYLENLQEP
jgi:hypothetical protein